MVEIDLHLGDCLDILPTLPSESVDAVITDPPYPCIKRDYGYWTVDEWWAMMRPVVAETRRILKPTGSAVFILQPNSEKVGKLRGWLWEFMAWVCREWNMVQDVWWWNYTAIPTFAASLHGLMRGSVKACVWTGLPNCFRNQELVLWKEADSTLAWRKGKKTFSKFDNPSGYCRDDRRMMNSLERREGVTPFNLIPCHNQGSRNTPGASGHGAGTPLKLADWWTRYICPPGGTVADWFMGSGTMGVAAVRNGCSFMGIEKMPGQGYFETAQERIEAEQAKAWQRKMVLC